MKKIISLFLVLAMVLSMASIVSAEEKTIPEKVEISFKVGDSTLMINGAAVTVETPYVVGAGTTLVPLRVITEAFGASVTWVNETKEIILEYPDVNITLQIGNVNATVNSHTETLPEAPVLSPNGVTMVPLRFISETFGATVGYDNATAAITVVKEMAEEDDMISSSTDLPRIGDSYWNWSVMNPSFMMMTDRLSDGCYTLFEDEDSGTISINIISIADYEGSAVDDRFNEMKTALSSYTFSKAEKSKDAFGNECFRIVARSKETYVDVYTVFKGEYYYQIAFTSDIKSEAVSPATSVVESFKLEFAANDDEKAQTYDLSNVGEDGYRTISDETLGISFKVPAACVDYDADQLNIIHFGSSRDDDPTEITVGVYSITEDVSAEKLTFEDWEYHVEYMNPEKCTVSDIMPYNKTNPGKNAYYYLVVSNGLFGVDYDFFDIFFEKGDYVYNVSITVPKGDSEIHNLIMSSLVIEELDSEETGVFLRNSIEETPKTYSNSDWAIEMTSLWSEAASSTSKNAMYLNLRNGSILNLTITDAGDIKRKDMKEVAGQLAKSSSGKVTKKVEEVQLGHIVYYTFQVVEESEEQNIAIYADAYTVYIGGEIYIFTLITEEEYANAKTIDDVEEFISTFDVK